MIDHTKPLTEQTAGDLRALIDALHGNRERYDRANRIVEARSCELEIAEATRALAILNRRATEAEDQRATERGPLDPALCRRLAGSEDTPAIVAAQLTAAAELAERWTVSEERAHLLTAANRAAEFRVEQAIEDRNAREAECDALRAQLEKRPALTEERVREVVREAIRVELEPNAATPTRCRTFANAIATRAAKELAGAVVSAAQRELQEWAIDVVFDGPPGPEAGRFVEVEDLSGKSVGVGQWIDRGNGLWALRIPRAHPAQREADLREAWITAIQWAFERSATEAEHARAAEYARSKAGG